MFGREWRRTFVGEMIAGRFVDRRLDARLRPPSERSRRFRDAEIKVIARLALVHIHVSSGSRSLARRHKGKLAWPLGARIDRRAI